MAPADIGVLAGVGLGAKRTTVRCEDIVDPRDGVGWWWPELTASVFN
jgi:hypothetical protein